MLVRDPVGHQLSAQQRWFRKPGGTPGVSARMAYREVTRDKPRRLNVLDIGRVRRARKSHSLALLPGRLG